MSINRARQRRRQDRIGDRHEMLVIIDAPADKPDVVVAQCDCGSVREYFVCNITRPGHKSCGCYKANPLTKATRRHGMSRTKVHNTWSGMMKFADDYKEAAA